MIFPEKYLQFYTSQKKNDHIWTKNEQKQGNYFWRFVQLPITLYSCIVHWVGPVPYLELFWAGPVKKDTLYMVKLVENLGKLMNLIVDGMKLWNQWNQ